MNVIVALPKLENAKSIRNLLMKYGFSVAGVATSGARTLSFAHELNDCIIISGYQLADMIYEELWESMPEYARMLLLTSKDVAADCGAKGIVYMEMPFRSNDLIDQVNEMADQMELERRRRRSRPKVRSKQEVELIQTAKQMLQLQREMTEEEAHHYLQKCSMENGTNLVETAQMVLSIYA